MTNKHTQKTGRIMDVKTLCLGILSRGDATGYEIRKQCEEGPFSHFYVASFGSIYPALNSLCDEGLASVREVNEDGRPARKIYTITLNGRLALTTALANPPAPDKLRSDFLFMTFFGHLLPVKQIDKVIEDRISALRREITEMMACREDIQPGGPAFTLGYGLAVYQAAADYLDAHRHELVGAALRNEVAGPAPKSVDDVLEIQS